MAIEEGFFETPDQERLFYRFQPGTTGRNLIVILHGHGEHSGRYLKFFNRLENLGCPLAVFDLRGNGRSSGPRAHVERFEDYLTDLSGLVHFLKSRYAIDDSLTLLGHSLGGLIATAWARQNPHEVSKLILSSPLFGLRQSKLLQGLVNLLNPFIPHFVVQNPVSPPFLTHDRSEVERYRTDPLIQRKITIRLVHEMLRYASIFAQGEVAFPFPVYILMAEEDLVVAPDATRRFFLRVRAPEKELESFAGFYHEIFNEIGQEKVFDQLRHYLGRPPAGTARQ